LLANHEKHSTEITMSMELKSTMGEATLEGVGGLRIFVRSWRPAGKARAAGVIVPGFNSHSGYYAWAAEQLVGGNLAVYALDLRGRGKSDGERFYVARFADYVSDVQTVIAAVKSREAGLPVYLLGHSAGGVIACTYALEHQAELAGLICESFAFKVPAPDFALAALRGLSHVAPHAHVLRLRNEDFSRDAAAVQAMNEDPLIEHETQATQTVAEMARAADRLEKEFPTLTLPLLILHGTNDVVTKPSGSQFFHDTARSADKTLKLYDGHFHDLLNDVDREVVIADIKEWIVARSA
jgi:alpha-beta hydrolase superfamily lysophospholipase